MLQYRGGVATVFGHIKIMLLMREWLGVREAEGIWALLLSALQEKKARAASMVVQWAQHRRRAESRRKSSSGPLAMARVGNFVGRYGSVLSSSELWERAGRARSAKCARPGPEALKIATAEAEEKGHLAVVRLLVERGEMRRTGP